MNFMKMLEKTEEEASLTHKSSLSEHQFKDYSNSKKKREHRSIVSKRDGATNNDYPFRHNQPK